ncbi:MAG: nucleotide exchange factor GrpE [Saprospiraceae bacterium]
MDSKKHTEEEKIVTAEAPPKEKKKRKFGSKTSKNAERIAELESELEESKDKHLRLYAEFENYKRRTVKERIDLMKNAAQDIMSSLLPVLDDFDRAKKSADNNESGEQFSEGVTLVYNKIHSTLQNKGLKVMKSNGELFNPEIHEAITEIPAPSDDMKGKIIDTIEKGYQLNDKIIRYAKVVVGK